MSRPGPRRPLELTEAQHRDLLARALEAGERTEAARQAMLAAGAERQQAILALVDGGLSLRDVAAEIGVSPSVVQQAVELARARAADNQAPAPAPAH